LCRAFASNKDGRVSLTKSLHQIVGAGSRQRITANYTARNRAC
jgi:hypothetical protein